MTYTAASHEGAINTFWLYFCGAIVSSIFVYSQWFTCREPDLCLYFLIILPCLLTTPQEHGQIAPSQTQHAGCVVSTLFKHSSRVRLLSQFLFFDLGQKVTDPCLIWLRVELSCTIRQSREANKKIKEYGPCYCYVSIYHIVIWIILMLLLV